jgi:hypothetical protein
MLNSCMHKCFISMSKCFGRMYKCHGHILFQILLFIYFNFLCEMFSQKKFHWSFLFRCISCISHMDEYTPILPTITINLGEKWSQIM